MRAYVWHTRDTGSAVIVLADDLETAKAIVLKRYPHNPSAAELIERKPIIHEDLELIYVFGQYTI